MFPDAVTTRGQKHVRELLAMKNKDIAPLFSLPDYMMALIVLKSLSLLDPEYDRLLKTPNHKALKLMLMRENLKFQMTFRPHFLSQKVCPID